MRKEIGHAKAAGFPELSEEPLHVIIDAYHIGTRREELPAAAAMEPTSAHGADLGARADLQAPHLRAKAHLSSAFCEACCTQNK